MKKTNKFLSLIMAMLFMCLSMVCVSAEDVIVYDEWIEFLGNDITVNEFEEAIEIVDSVGNNEEIMPMAAGECGEEDDEERYPLVNGYYGSPGVSGGGMRVMDGGYAGACAFFTYLTTARPVNDVTTPIPNGGTARITPSSSALSGYAVQIQTGGNQPFKSQRVHFN